MKRARFLFLLAICLVVSMAFGGTVLAEDESDSSVQSIGKSKGNISIQKTVNTEDGDPLSGVVFKLYWGSIKVIEGTTNPEGKLNFNDLFVGEYRLVETVPQGYTCPWQNNETTVTVEKNKTKKVKVVNTEKPGKICIEKREGSLEGYPMEGITFTLFSGETQVAVDSTDTEGKLCFEELTPGTYTLVENVPAGYTTSLEENNQFTVGPGETVQVAVVNTEKLGTICIEKRKGNAQGDPMSGIPFTLWSENEQQWQGTTNESGMLCFEGLVAGDYLLEEDVPSGYTTSLPENYIVTVSPGETVYVQVINTRKSEPTPKPKPKPRDRSTPTPVPTELDAASIALPRTGGLIEWEWIALAGGMLSGCGGGLYLLRRRRMKK